ncbi:IniB N-terminal domain-containing protein [Plantactinospora sonchi]|uniref:IniB N-terminal domain-containing protein n=1 Tax=Plantactinospora sonchi TaxID=1544735 RepID=A0ABU7RL77_9ACTN
MGSPQTLHDFVLNLLTNPDARSAFELDPEGTLRDAGLTDITVADVQDVVPLVVDYAPVQGLGSLVPVTEDLGLEQFQPDPTAVIGQLQHVAYQLTANTHSTGSDLNTAALGVISTVSPASLGVVGTGLGLDAGQPVPALPADEVAPTEVDVDGTLDSVVTEPVVSDVTGAVGVPGGLDTGQLGLVDFAGDTLDGTLDQVTGLVGSLGVTDGLGGVGALDVGDSVAGLTDAVGGVGDTLDVSPLSTSSGDPALDDLGVGSTVTGLTDHVGETLRGTTSGLVGDTGPTGDENASTSGGLLGITDGLL